jgi:hypothetical protein
MKRIVDQDAIPQSGAARPGRHDTRKDDTLSRNGARELARRLQDYWHARGYPAVRFWTEPVGERFGKIGTHEVHRVVCNLVNGLPPRYRDEPTRKTTDAVTR